MAESTPPQPPPGVKAAPSGLPEAVTQEQVPHHIPARKKREAAPAKMDLNLTSMIDVTFQLLIYFIITAAFTAGEGVLTAKFPQGTGAQSAEKPPDRKITIHLTVGTTSSRPYGINVNRGAAAGLSFSELIKWLKENKFDAGGNGSGAFTKETPVEIHPNGDVRWTYVVNAFNAAVAAGYENVAFAQAGGDE